jgi:hypothetical protein
MEQDSTWYQHMEGIQYPHLVGFVLWNIVLEKYCIQSVVPKQNDGQNLIFLSNSKCKITLKIDKLCGTDLHRTDFRSFNTYVF